MSHSPEAQPAGNHDGPTAAMRWIGELDHPFYDDERNRHIWYEGQSIAFQFVGLASYVLIGVVLLVVGAPALPYAMVMLVPFLLSTLLLKAWVGRHGADYWPRRSDLRRSRGKAVLAVTLFTFAGFARAYLDTEGASSGLAGMVVGGALAGVLLSVMARRQQNQEAAELTAPDVD